MEYQENKVKQKRAAAYLRVSTDNQAMEDSYGLPAQEEAILAYAHNQGIEVVDYFIDDGYSDATLDRPGLQKLIKESGSKRFDVVLVAKMDRIARDFYYSLFIEKELLINEIEIISVSEPVSGNDPMNTAFRQLMAVFAQLERDMITVRMSNGRKQKASQGGYSSGRAALEYYAKRGAKKLRVDSNKARAAKRTFELRAKHPEWSLRQLAECLNEEGYTTAQGKKLGPMQIKRILDGEAFYNGHYSYGDIVLTTEEAAKRIGVKQTTVRTWLNNGLLEGTKVGGGKLWRISEEALEEFISNK